MAWIKVTKVDAGGRQGAKIHVNMDHALKIVPHALVNRSRVSLIVMDHGTEEDRMIYVIESGDMILDLIREANTVK